MKPSTTSGTTTHTWRRSCRWRASCPRFAPNDGDGPFIAIYELDCDDLDAAVQRLGELGATGTMTGLDNLAMDPKPIPKVYREIGSLGP